MSLHELTALQLGEHIRARAVSVPETVQAALTRIEATEPKINAYITITAKEAMEQADEVQRRLDRGEILSPLAGVPMALKDNICTKGIKTTCASKMLSEYIPPYDATAAARLKAAGAILLGKLNMDEFAMGSTSETSWFGPSRNPWDPAKSPGGSSGGSAAAVANRSCWYSIGSDTGGSIRQPASYCGITGLKPTYGAVSRYGLVAYASSLDQLGPMALTAADCAAVLDMLLGRDHRDSTSLEASPSSLLSALNGDLRGLRIGLPSCFFGAGLDNEVHAAVLEVAAVLRGRGASVEEFDLPALEYAIPAYQVIAASEASSNLACFDGVGYGLRPDGCVNPSQLTSTARSEGFGLEVKKRILFGTFMTTQHGEVLCRKAMQARSLVREALVESLKNFHLLLTPATSSTAPPLGVPSPDPRSAHLTDLCSVPANLAGLPALSMPCGLDAQGMPIGAQLIGPALGEGMVLNAAHAFQLDTFWHTFLPKGGESL